MTSSSISFWLILFFFLIFAQVAYSYFYSICSFHLNKKKGGKGYLLQRTFRMFALGDASAEVPSRSATAPHHTEKLQTSQQLKVFPEQGSSRAGTWSALGFPHINNCSFLLLLRSNKIPWEKETVFLCSNKQINVEILDVMPDMSSSRKMDSKKKEDVFCKTAEPVRGSCSWGARFGRASSRPPWEPMYYFLTCLRHPYFRLWPAQQDNLSSNLHLAQTLLSLSPASGRGQ